MDDSKLFVESADTNIYTFYGQTTFREGMRRKAIQFTPWQNKSSLRFKIGYYLWGLDIWIGKVPMIKLMVAMNLSSLVLVWILK